MNDKAMLVCFHFDEALNCDIKCQSGVEAVRCTKDKPALMRKDACTMNHDNPNGEQCTAWRLGRLV